MAAAAERGRHPGYGGLLALTHAFREVGYVGFQQFLCDWRAMYSFLFSKRLALAKSITSYLFSALLDSIVGSRST